MRVVDTKMYIFPNPKCLTNGILVPAALSFVRHSTCTVHSSGPFNVLLLLICLGTISLSSHNLNPTVMLCKITNSFQVINIIFV